jgi:hypothetical protein
MENYLRYERAALHELSGWIVKNEEGETDKKETDTKRLRMRCRKTPVKKKLRMR